MVALKINMVFLARVHMLPLLKIQKIQNKYRVDIFTIYVCTKSFYNKSNFCVAYIKNKKINGGTIWVCMIYFFTQYKIVCISLKFTFTHMMLIHKRKIFFQYFSHLKCIF
jgi:hypothetical protein